MPKFKVLEDNTEKKYSEFAPEVTEEIIRKFIRKKTPSVKYAEDGLPVRSDLLNKGIDSGTMETERRRLTPAEAETVRKNIKKIVQYAIDDSAELTLVPEQANLDNYLGKMKQGYVPLRKDEMSKRAALSDRFRKKYAEYAAKRTIVTGLLKSSDPDIDRTMECLFWIDTSVEAIKWNEQLKADLFSPDSSVRKSAMARALNRIAMSSPAQSADLHDDASFCDNMESFYSMLSSGPEITNLLKKYAQMPGAPDPDLQKNLKHLLNAEDVSYFLRMKIDVCCSPIYSRMRTEDFWGNKDFSSTEFTPSPKEAPIEMEEMLYPDEEPDYFASFPIKQITIANTLNEFAKDTLLNKNLSQEERYTAFVKACDKQIQNKVEDIEQKLSASYQEPVMDKPAKAAPDTAALRLKIGSISETLKSTEHWYNALSSSKEYKRMKTALQKTADELDKLAKNGSNADKFQDAMKELRKSITEYQEHVGLVAKNDNQKKRQTAADELDNYLKNIDFDALDKTKQPGRTVKKGTPVKSINQKTPVVTKGTGTPGKAADKSKNIQDLSEMFSRNQQKVITGRPDTSPQKSAATEDKFGKSLTARKDSTENPAERKLCEILLETRKELSGLLNKQPFDVQKAKSLLAASIVCNTLISEQGGNAEPSISVGNRKTPISKMNENDIALYLKTGRETVQNGDNFKAIEKKISNESIRQYLQDKTGGSHSPIMQEFFGDMKRSTEIKGRNTSGASVNPNNRMLRGASDVKLRKGPGQ